MLSTYRQEQMNPGLAKVRHWLIYTPRDVSQEELVSLCAASEELAGQNAEFPSVQAWFLRAKQSLTLTAEKGERRD